MTTLAIYLVGLLISMLAVIYIKNLALKNALIVGAYVIAVCSFTFEVYKTRICEPEEG
jgi:hypothetical protein